MQSVKFSIVVPAIEFNDLLSKCVASVLRETFTDWELLIITDSDFNFEWSDSRIKKIQSGKVGPATKRDIAARIAIGEFLVFLDDDSYLGFGYLQELVKILDRHSTEIKVIGGPGITPPDNSVFQKASGVAFEFPWPNSVSIRYRVSDSELWTDDWPTVNLVVQKRYFDQIGGFDNIFWPGEDSKFCEKIIQSGYRILYCPQLIVYHHRRQTLRKHLNQVGNYGKHRGMFFMEGDSNSYHFGKLLGIVFFALLCLAFFIFSFGDFSLLIAPAALYSTIVLLYSVDVSKRFSIIVGLLSIIYLPLTQLYYAWCFIKGILHRVLRIRDSA